MPALSAAVFLALRTMMLTAGAPAVSSHIRQPSLD
jgi:hypothetical protein